MSFVIVREDLAGWRPAPHPVKHDCPVKARAEATRLARKEPGVKFHVVSVVGTAQLRDPVEWVEPCDPLPF